MNKKIKKIQDIYYIIVFLDLLIGEITGTIFSLYLLEKNQNLLQINIIIAVFFIGILLFEIPTGVIADLFGRRISVALSFALSLISSVIFLVAENTTSFVLAEIVSAIGATMMSGALEAWAIDSMEKCEKKEENVVVLFSKGTMIRQFAGIICGVVSGYLASLKYEYTWYMSIFLSFFTMCIALLLMKENYQKKEKKQVVSSLKHIWKESWNFGANKKYIVFLIMAGAIFNWVNASGNSYQQPRLVSLFNNEVWVMGWIKAGYSLMLIAGSWVFKKLYNRKKCVEKIMHISSYLVAIFLFGAGWFNFTITVVLSFYLYEFSRGMFSPAFQCEINKKIKSEQRATVLSISSAVSDIGMILGLLISGIIANMGKNGIRNAWEISGAIGLIAFMILYKVKERREKNT